MQVDLSRQFYRAIGLSDTVFQPQVSMLFTSTMRAAPVMKANEVMLFGDIVDEQEMAAAKDYGVTEGLISPSDFKNRLDEVAKTHKEVMLRINSRGGNIMAAGVIHQSVMEIQREQDVRVEATIDGVAASAASFVMLAAAKRYAHRLSSVMIHSARGFSFGTATDFRKVADLLDGQNMKVAPLYAEAMNTDTDSVLTLMEAETWYHGEQIVDAGFAHMLLDGPDRKTKATMQQQEKEGFSAMQASWMKYE